MDYDPPMPEWKTRDDLRDMLRRAGPDAASRHADGHRETAESRLNDDWPGFSGRVGGCHPPETYD